MLDTSDNIIQKQREIFFAKTANERFLIGIETIAFGRIIVENSIKQSKSNISELELKIAVFKRYYKDVFNKDEFDKIISSLTSYHKQNKGNKIL